MLLLKSKIARRGAEAQREKNEEGFLCVSAPLREK
jgi:hypothetical protein